jgi:luciferase family oxidoreductase group 1
MSACSHNPLRLNLGVIDCCAFVLHTIALAEEADRLGFTRYWLTEHPPQPNPQMLAALLAGATDRIRVGAAGLLLNYHAPIAAAQQFLLMEHLFPGRVDAGFCAGSTQELAHEPLLDGRPDTRGDSASFERRAEEFISFIRNDFPLGHRYESVSAWPGATGVPEIWSFGTGQRSAALAARRGTAFGYSLFHSFSRDDTTSFDAYRDNYRPSEFRRQPLAAIAVGGVCAETEHEAQRLKAMHKNPYFAPTVVGSPRQCREMLESIAVRYGTREVVFMDLAPEVESRLRSLQLLAAEFELPIVDEGVAALPLAYAG